MYEARVDELSKFDKDLEKKYNLDDLKNNPWKFSKSETTQTRGLSSSPTLTGASSKSPFAMIRILRPSRR